MSFDTDPKDDECGNCNYYEQERINLEKLIKNKNEAINNLMLACVRMKKRIEYLIPFAEDQIEDEEDVEYLKNIKESL